MKYFLIAGEASGDLHAAHLMKALREVDAAATFVFQGGDAMQAVGGECMRHYADIAYMGFIPVMLHARTLLRAMSECRAAIARHRPDVVILVDYPGFNLPMARYVHNHLSIPVYYYISPKIWAWKERRIRSIRRYVSELFSILPFEIDFFEKRHHYPIHYVGNPSVGELEAFRRDYHETFEAFARRHSLSAKPVIALLPGSRRQEVTGNLSRMLAAASGVAAERGYQLVVARVGSLPDALYADLLRPYRDVDVHLVCDATYPLLAHAQAALVTSGTATLETGIMRVPQVVCYYAKGGVFLRMLKRIFLKVPYISLVNLIVGRELVPELIADRMAPAVLRRHLLSVLPGGERRAYQMEGYEERARLLGPSGAAERAAAIMYGLLCKN